MYYHVIIYPTDGRGSLGGFIPNLQQPQLEERILQPYRQGQSITVSGATISSTDVARLRILETAEELSKHYFKSISMGANPFMGYNNEELNTLVLVLDRMGRDITDALVTGAAGYARQGVSAATPTAGPAADPREVFVVHGRNTLARDALFTFLLAIGLQPLEWPKAVKATGKTAPYISEILETVFSLPRPIVVLFTPDDVARLKQSLQSSDDPSYETELTGQARQNVLFEAGMAMAGNQDRTIFVEFGSVRPLSDIAGIHRIRLDNGSECRQELAERLQLAGCPASLEGTHWHTAGEFDAALKSVEASAESAGNVEQQPPTPVSEQLSEEARELLLHAAKDKDGAIHRISTSGGVMIRVRGKLFNEPRDPRSEALWEGVLDELIESGLINDRKGERKYFQMTREGFEEADRLASTP